MSQWNLDNPPLLAYLGNKKPVATKRGWEHPDTGELLVAISNLVSKAGASNIIKIMFSGGDERGENLTATVYFNERVTVGAGSTLVVTSEGGNITLKAAAQSNVQEVVYNKQNGDGTTQEVIPDRADTYTVEAQTIGGTITDAIGAVAASGTLTLTDVPSNNETVVIDSKTYTFKTTLTNTDGYVLIGATKELCLDNLAAAINLGAGAGTLYAAATTVHSTVTASGIDATLVVTAKTAGTAGNSLSTTDTLANGSWGASTLAGGAAATSSSRAISAPVAGAVTSLVIPPGSVESVELDESAYTQGDNITVTVTMTEAVDVTAGASIVLTTDSADLTLYAAAQSDVTEVVFNKQSDNSTAAVVPTDTAASGILTLSGNATNGQTVTIGTKVYTFQDTLTNVNGNVKIGAAATNTIDNLIAAINLDAGAGTLYAAATTAHPTVEASAGSGDTMNVTAIDTGSAGNSIATTETLSSGSFASATLTGGITAPTTLFIEGQDIDGDIVDHGNNSVAADVEISDELASEAGEAEVTA